MHCYSLPQHALGSDNKTWRPSLVSLCFRCAATILSLKGYYLQSSLSLNVIIPLLVWVFSLIGRSW